MELLLTAKGRRRGGFPRRGESMIRHFGHDCSRPRTQGEMYSIQRTAAASATIMTNGAFAFDSLTQ
jgi:hypothetical protein